MPLRTLKDKIANVAGGEVLGDASAGKKEKQVKDIKQSKPSKPSKPSRPIKPAKPAKPSVPKKIKQKKKPKKVEVEEVVTKRRHSIFSMKSEELLDIDEDLEDEEEEEDEEKALSIISARDTVEGYEDILLILGIKEKSEVDADFTSEKLDYIDFAQTQPIGFDFEEVADFISRTKYSMHKLESALEQRDRDIVKIASQAKRIENKMVEANQQRELDRMTGQGMTEEERLIEKNMELNTIINELRTELKPASANKKMVKTLEKELERVKIENDLLRSGNLGSAPSRLPKAEPLKPFPTSLPTLEDKVGMFEGMLNDIGGLYDEQEE